MSSCAHDALGRFDIMHELSLAHFAKRYQIDCAFCGLLLQSVDYTEAAKCTSFQRSVDAHRTQEEKAARHNMAASILGAFNP